MPIKIDIKTLLPNNAANPSGGTGVGGVTGGTTGPGGGGCAGLARKYPLEFNSVSISVFVIGFDIFYLPNVKQFFSALIDIQPPILRLSKPIVEFLLVSVPDTLCPSLADTSSLDLPALFVGYNLLLMLESLPGKNIPVVASFVYTSDSYHK